MRKTSSLIGLMTVLLVSLFVMSSFTAPAGSGSSEKSCKVKITTKDGYAAEYITVTLETGGFASGCYKDFRTDKNGEVVLTWESTPKYLHIKGDKYSVDYEDGGSYSLTLRKNYSEL